MLRSCQCAKLKGNYKMGVYSNRGPVIATGKECQWCNISRAVPSAIRFSAGCGCSGSPPGQRDDTGKNRPAPGLLHHPGTPRRSLSAGNWLAGSDLHQHRVAVWANHHPLLTHLIRCLHFFTAKYNIHIKAPHIVGSCNMAADALSHNKLSMFFHSNPQAAREPSQIPAALVDMSLQQRLD